MALKEYKYVSKLCLVRNCDIVLEKGALRRLIMRTLVNRELSGYDLWKELGAKGVKIRTNYLYMALVDMHARDLLNARWVDNPRGPRRHLYSLSAKGQKELTKLLAESLEFVAAAFTRANVTARNLPEHVESVRTSFSAMGLPPPGQGKKIVLTTPPLDPLICFPLSYQAFGEAFPRASITVVKPAGMALIVDCPNVTFVDGNRNSVPLKDGFADYLFLEGFPAESSVEATIAESLRVLKDEGYLIARVPAVMTEEKKPGFSNLAEFAYRAYFDFTGLDRVVSVERVKQILSKHATSLGERVDRDNVVIWGKVSKRQPLSPSGAIQSRQATTGSVRIRAGVLRGPGGR